MNEGRMSREALRRLDRAARQFSGQFNRETDYRARMIPDSADDPEIFFGVVDSCSGSTVSVKKATGGSFEGTGGPTYSTSTIDCIAMTDYVRVGDQGLVVKFGGLSDYGYVFFPIVKFGLVKPPDGSDFTEVDGELAVFQDGGESATCEDPS